MNFTLDLYDLEPFWTFDFPTKIGFSIMIFSIQGFGIVVHRKLISFLKYKSRRPVNKIIYKNIILQNIFYPPLLWYCLIDIWGFIPGYYISQFGCYGFFYAGLFIISHDRAHSFFINLFRYICIVKEEILREKNIQPKVSPLNFLFYKLTKFLKIFEIFFCTLWWAYLNICLCFGCTGIGRPSMP